MTTCRNCGEENPPRFRLCGFCGTPLVQELPEPEVRKTVTVVFSDLKGSTAMGERLDPESVREVMSRYFDVMREALERYGGRVEKYIGDAIMAVFGLPRVREDDALRAVRAALDMRDALGTLNDELKQRWGVTLENRTGINTGEVVAGDPTLGQRLVTGDTVNTAARLEQAASPLEVLIGDRTFRLVRDHVAVEEVEPLALQGKAERIPAYRLVGLGPSSTTVSSPGTSLVGRLEELASLEARLAEAMTTRSPRLVVLLGEAGVGKSRLIDALSERTAGTALCLRGRCLSYGRGITFWPIAEVVAQAASIESDDTPELARAKISALVGGNAATADRVAAAIGLPGPQFAIEELFFGIRTLLERIAERRPTVVVIEDIHWAEPTLLELLERVTRTASGPMLVVCTSRPDILEREQSWVDAPALVLEPLSEDETAQMLANQLGDGTVAPEVLIRVMEAAEGNPLFAEQLLSMLVDDGLLHRENGHWTAAAADLSKLEIPPTINALLEARLDLLTREERVAIEPASVIGLNFPRAALDELVPEALRTDLHLHLDALERKRLVVAVDSAGEMYRFQHILIRDAAYNSLLKRTRAQLHERFADWGERVNRERDREQEFEEINGYHLEQAYTYLAELGPVDDHGRALGARAATKLASAGRRALERGDMGAAANLLRRAASLLSEHEPMRLQLLPDLGEAMMEIGEFAWAEVYLDEVVEAAAASGDERLRADGLLTRLLIRHHTTEDFEAWRGEVERETAALLPALEKRDAFAELSKTWRIRAFIHATLCHWEETAAAQLRATEYARLAGQTRQEARLSAAYTMALADGPTPVPEAVELCREIIDRGLPDRQAEALELCSLATLLAMGGDFTGARAACDRARGLQRELGAPVFATHAALASARIELLAGDPGSAEQVLDPEQKALAAMGERYYRPLVLAVIGQALYRQGRLDEADELARLAGELAASDDVEPQALWRLVRAKVLTARGEGSEARALAREAVELLEPTDALLIRAEALVDYSIVLELTANRDEARGALEESLRLCRLKQMAAPTDLVERLLADLCDQQPEAVA